MHKQRSACTCKQHYMHTGRRGQKMHRAVAAGINAPLCAPNIQLIVQILTGCIINADLHFAGAGSRSPHGATRKGALCSSSATAPLVSLLSMHCCNLLSFFAQRRVFRCSGGWRQYNQNTSLSQRSTGFIYCTTWKVALRSGLADGWSAACLLARARKSLINDSLWITVKVSLVGKEQDFLTTSCRNNKGSEKNTQCK